jgi:probable addiction module antidote protein
LNETVSPFEPSEYLDSEEAIAEYLTAIIDEGNVDLFVSALGDVAKSRGMTQIASECGVGRESLYKSLREGSKPRFETIFKVLVSMGLHFELKPNPHLKASLKRER